MATLTLRCRCGKTITVAEQHRGKRIRCTQCGRTMRAGGPDLRRWTMAGSLGFLAFIVLATVMVWGLGDKWWPATALLFISRWVLLLPLAVLVPAALLYHRWMLAPLALAAFLGIVPLAGFRFGVPGRLGRVEGPRLRAATFNVDGGNQMAFDLPSFLDEWKPDVVAFQECGPALQSAVVRLKGWYHHTVRQLCFLSRFAIRDSAVMDRSTLDAAEQSGQGIGGAGDVARYTLETPNGAISVTNLHLETPRKGLEGVLSGDFAMDRLRANTDLRAIESSLARRWVDKGTHPTIVMGDFNTPVESRIFQESWGDLADAFSTVGFGFGMTKNNGWIRVRIDHVLAGPDWKVDKVTVGNDGGSDHLPLIADLTFAPEASGGQGF